MQLLAHAKGLHKLLVSANTVTLFHGQKNLYKSLMATRIEWYWAPLGCTANGIYACSENIFQLMIDM